VRATPVSNALRIYDSMGIVVRFFQGFFWVLLGKLGGLLDPSITKQFLPLISLNLDFRIWKKLLQKITKRWRSISP
jgi:hypothetical protein